MAKPQVRLDPDVAEALQARANDSGRSLSAEADAWLRRALGLSRGSSSPAALAHPAPGTSRADVQRAGANAVVRAPTGPVLGRSFGTGGWQGPPRLR